MANINVGNKNIGSIASTKRMFFLLLFVAAGAVWCAPSFALPQSIPPSDTLTVDGQNEGVTITAPATLTVDGTGGFTNIGFTGGSSVSTDAINQGIVLFSVSSVVSKDVGDVINTLDQVNADNGATTVDFNGTVFTRIMGIGTGTVNFNSGTLGAAGNKGAITFTDDGTINVAANTSFTGALNAGAAQRGTLNLMGATAGTDQWIGGVGAAGGLRSINVDGGSTAGVRSQITGTVDTYAFGLGTNRLDIVGTFNLRAGPGGGINTTLASPSVYGNIADGLAGTYTGAAATVNVTVPAGAVLPAGTIFTIVNDSGAGAGTTPILVTVNNSLYTFTPGSTLNGDLQIQLAGTPLTTSTLPAATVIQNVPSTADLNTVIGAINNLTDTSAVTDAVSQLNPNNNGATTQVVFNAVNEAMGALTTHLGEAGNNPRPGRSGISTGDFWKNNGIWARGFGDIVEQDTHKGVSGYDSKMWGAIGGIDGIITNELLLGLAGGYAATNVDGQGDTGGTDIDSYIGTIYFSYDDPSPWYGDMGFTFTWNAYDSNRRIVFPGIDRTAESSTDGQTYTGFGDIGYVIPMNAQWNVTPIAGLTYSHISIDKYTETGAGDLNLIVNSQDYDQLLSNLGVRIDATIKNDSGKWVPEAHFRWLYDFIGDAAATTSTFTGGGSAFDTKGLDPEKSTYNVGAGVTFYSKGHISITGTYDYRFGTDFSSHTGQGVIRYTF